jgi:hypothetical protein
MQEEVEFKNKVLLVLGCKNLKGKVEFQLGTITCLLSKHNCLLSKHDCIFLKNTTF